MTTEELIQAFPECEKIKRKDIAEYITKAMTEERFYAEASDKIYNKAYELWPYQRGLKDDDPERVAYGAYFWGDTWKGVVAPFKEWLETFKTEFIAQHGQVRTFDEACQTAADEWARMIFGNHVQLQLDISGFPGTLNAGLHEGFSQAEPPVFLQDTYAEFGAVLYLVFAADGFDSGHAGNLAVHDGNKLYFIRAFCFFSQELSFLFRIITVFIRI